MGKGSGNISTLTDKFIVYGVQRPDAVIKNAWNTNVFINGVYIGTARRVDTPLKDGVYTINGVGDLSDVEGVMNGRRIVLSANVNKAAIVDGYLLNKEFTAKGMDNIATESKCVEETEKKMKKIMTYFKKHLDHYVEKKIWIESMSI